MTRPASFDAAVMQWRPLLYRVARSYQFEHLDADDLVQMAITNALDAWEGFRSDGHFPTWLVWKLRAAAHDIKRKGRSGKRTFINVPLDGISVSDDHGRQEDIVFAKQMVELLTASGDAKYVLPIALGATGAEVAEQFGVARQSVNKSVRRSEARLRKQGFHQ